MASNWSVCGVCDYRHLTKPSVVWCSECDEGLCEECIEHHSISKGSRNHNTVFIAEYQKLPNNVLQLALSCDKHNEKYQLFCKKHDCPCCKKCIVEAHTDCKDIDDITRHIKSTNAFAELQQNLSEVAANVKRLRTHREENLASLGKKSREIEKEVQETRSKINQHLDRLQNDILKELKRREEEESNKIRRILKSLTDKEHEITEHQTNISNIKQYASELQTFLALKHIEKDVLFEEQYIQSMIKSDGANHINVSCQINPSLQGLPSAIETFGDVVVTVAPCKIPILKQKNKQAQMIVDVKPFNIDSLTSTLLQSFDANMGVVTGCTLLPDSRMVFACYSSELIRVLKQDGSPEFDIRNLGPVFDMTLIGDNVIAVTSGYHKRSSQINVIDLKTRKVKKTLKVNLENTGVAYHEDNLLYCAGRNGIQMVNLNDESITIVTKTVVPYDSYVVPFRDNIFFTDFINISVTCIDFHGNIQWVFTNKNVLKNPFGISVDNDGNVYVIGGSSNNLVVISPNGQNHRELLTSENGLDGPAVVHVNRSSSKMLVANRKGKAFVYSFV